MAWALKFDTHFGFMRAMLKPSDDRFIGDVFSAHERLVLMALLVHTQDGKSWPGITALVRGTGLSRRSVIRALDSLENANMIERTRRPHGQTTLYRITVLEKKKKAPTSATQTLAK